ncbi:NUDIX domain-containing protein [Variovorax paradoxus]|nr:NUDIX domain-containing protein [Variovorax paradoxus]
MNEQFDLAVCIGRFQLFHDGQAALIRRGLEIAPLCIVVIGSAHQARSLRNPFTWEERAEMIRISLPEADRARVQFMPVRDYFSQERWAAAVRDCVAAAPGRRGARLVDVGRQGDLHAKDLRAALFTGQSVKNSLAAIAGQVPPTTLDFLEAWTHLPYFAALRAEWQALAAEQSLWAGSPFPPAFVTVDAVVHMAGHVLLIRRGRAPGKGRLALPGGFLEQRETVYQSAVRELEEETGFRLLPSTMRAALREVRVFDHPDRSQRGRVITHAHYFALGDGPLPEVRGSDDASEAMWVPQSELAGMETQFHDDHFYILDVFMRERPVPPDGGRC